MFSTILIFILVLGLLVFVHELGHFLMAKKSGMKVEEFGFGFPPRAFGYRPRGSETTYSVNWIPIGGFVKIKGESGEYRTQPDSFASKPAWKRLLVLVAGVAMNLVLAAFLLGVGYLIGLPSAIDQGVPVGASVRDERIRVVQVVPESPAAEAGIATGDTILAIDGRTFESSADAREYIAGRGSEGMRLLLEGEDGTRTETDVVHAKQLDGYETFGLGVGLVTVGIVSLPPHLALVQGMVATGQLTWEVVKAFVGLFVSLVVRQEVAVDLSGPIGIAVLTGEVAALGFIYLLQFTAVLSVNLAVINILPFPALDGGRALFVLIEKLRRKPIDERFEAVAHNFGFVLLMLLVVLVTYRDLVRYGGEIWGAVKGLVGV